MYRPSVIAPYRSYSRSWQETWARLLLAPLTLWICVSVTVLYGYYGNRSLVLGPGESRLLQTNSVFVERIQVRDEGKKGLVVYGFSEKPELSLETSWSVCKYLLVGTYRRQGFSLWLNQGSRIVLNWTVQISDFDDLFVDLIKGEHNYEKLQPLDLAKSPNSHFFGNQTRGTGKVEYLIEEEDRYFVCVSNMNPRIVMIAMNITVASTMYDTSKAMSNCSTTNGLCQLKLLFPKPHFLILRTPNNGDLEGWSIELSFIGRMLAYVLLLGFLMGLIFLIMKYLETCHHEGRAITLEEAPVLTERDPLVQSGKSVLFNYGTGEEDEESGMHNSSSEDLYDGKICVICYDGQRNCFFVPCGHCATCFECAQRIVNVESKVCPICRRFIHKVRRLFIS